MNDFSLTSKTFLANFTLLSYNPKQFWIKLNVVWVCLYIPYFNARFWDSYWNYSFSGLDVFTNCTRFYDFLLWPMISYCDPILIPEVIIWTKLWICTTWECLHTIIFHLITYLTYRYYLITSYHAIFYFF